MIFYVIGNGFDRHYGLPTSYSDYKEYLMKNGHEGIVKKMDDLFFRYGFNPEVIESWAELEDMLSVFNQLDGDEILDEAIDNAQQDDERADYFDSPTWNVDYYNDYIRVLKQQFEKWITQINTNIVRDDFFHPHAGDCVLSFNYTSTIEDNFNTSDIQIIHIHGTVGQEVVLGHNDFCPPNYLPVIEDDDCDFRTIKAEKAVNAVLELASSQYYKDSPSIMRKNADLFASIADYDKVVFMGLSCGAQDMIYIQEIVKHAAMIDFYYYDDKAKEQMSYVVKGVAVEVNYIHW